MYSSCMEPHVVPPTFYLSSHLDIHTSLSMASEQFVSFPNDFLECVAQHTIQYPYPPSGNSAAQSPDESSLYLPVLPYTQYSASSTDTSFASGSSIGWSNLDPPYYPGPPSSLVAEPHLTAAVAAPPTIPAQHCYESSVASRPRNTSFSRNSSLYSSSSPAKAINNAFRPYYGRRRQKWDLALEQVVFTPQEIISLNPPARREIYRSSLEAHIDRLHTQLLEHRLFPVPLEDLSIYRGLNKKTAKSLISKLCRDASKLRVKKLELEHSNSAMRSMLCSPQAPQMQAFNENGHL